MTILNNSGQHCSQCGWRGTVFHCAWCCRSFDSMAAFGAHVVGPNHDCRSDGEIAARGLRYFRDVWAWAWP